MILRNLLTAHRGFHVFIFLAGVVPSLCAQSKTKTDSTGASRDSSRVEYVNLNFMESGKQHTEKGEYSLDRFQFYLPVYESNYVNATLGTNGSAMGQWNFRPEFNNGFNWGMQLFDPYLLNLKDIRFYDVQTPLSQFSYFQSGKANIQFNALHTQNFGKAWNVGIEYKRTSAEGSYTRQAVTHSSLRLHSWFRPEGGRYQAMLAINYVNGSGQENGGITATGDTLFSEDIERNRKLIPISLGSSRNKIFNNGILLRHSYAVIRTKSDSLNKLPRRPLISLQQTISYQFRHLSYSDENPDSGYYSSVADSNLFFVDYDHSLTENEFALVKMSSSLDSSGKMEWEGKWFLKQQFGSIKMPYAVTGNTANISFSNQSVGGFLTCKFSRKLSLNAETEFFYSGYNVADTKLSGKLKINLLHAIIETGVESFAQEPVYQLSRFVSNFESWNNSFQKINLVHFFGRIWLEKPRIYAQVGNRTIGNWVYMSQNRLPAQSNVAVNILSAELIHSARLGHWNLQSRLLFQQVSGADVIRIPAFQFQESFFYKGRIKKTTEFRIGLDFIGCSAFRASAYQTESGLFFLQDSVKNEGLLQVDFYVAFKIRRIRILVKLDHLNAGIGAYNYDLIPSYPLPDRSLKVGFSWVFFD